MILLITTDQKIEKYNILGYLTDKVILKSSSNVTKNRTVIPEDL